MSEDILFAVRGLTIRRGGVSILRDVNWTVRRQEQWVILGANGSGKTSLLKALTGYMNPTSGDIQMLGHTYGRSDWRELRERIGIVSASISNLMHDEDIALDVVVGGRRAMIGHWGKMTEEERITAARLLTSLRVGYAAERRWKVLSQGERQRVLIARALMAAPDLLILDEPAAGLDPVAREKFLVDIGRLARRKSGPGLVLVTHHIEEITPEFTHLLALRDGRVVFSGPKESGLDGQLLSRIFKAPLRVEVEAGRYRLAHESRRSPR